MAVNIFVYKWTPKFKDICNKRNSCEVSSPIFHTLANETVVCWQIDFYPNGCNPLITDKSSIYLRLVGTNSTHRVISAKFAFEMMSATAGQQFVTPKMSNYQDFRLNTINATSLSFDTFTPNLASMAANFGTTSCKLLLLGEDRLLIKCTIELSAGLFRVVTPANETDVPVSTFPKGGPHKQLFETHLSTLPDVIFVSKEGKKFYCHSDVFIEKSTFFKRLFEKDQKLMEETEITVVTISGTKIMKSYRLNDVEAEVFTEVTRYVYTEYIDKVKIMAARVLPVAYMFKLSVLEAKCVDYLIEMVANENAIEYLILADKHQEDGLRKKCITYIVEELKEIIQKDAWKPFLRNYPHLVLEIFDEVADQNVLAAF